MKNVIVIAAVVLAACSTVSRAQTPPAAAQTATPQEQSAAPAGTGSASDNLSDLDTMTFACPKAALNAAAREAAKVPSQGNYQFAYFKIISNSHHSSYEIRFKSNFEGEADVKYCVSLYCQQGWDPKTSKTSVTLMSDERQRAGVSAHGSECGHAAPVSRRLKR